MVFIVFTIVVLVFPGSAYASDDTSLEYLKTVIEMVMERYRGEITEEQLIEGALKGIFDTMDVTPRIIPSKKRSRSFLT